MLRMRRVGRMERMGRLICSSKCQELPFVRALILYFIVKFVRRINTRTKILSTWIRQRSGTLLMKKRKRILLRLILRLLLVDLSTFLDTMIAMFLTLQKKGKKKMKDVFSETLLPEEKHKRTRSGAAVCNLSLTGMLMLTYMPHNSLVPGTMLMPSKTSKTLKTLKTYQEMMRHHNAGEMTAHHLQNV